MVTEIPGDDLEDILEITEGAVSGSDAKFSSLEKRLLEGGYDLPSPILRGILDAAGELLKPPESSAGSFLVVSGIDKAGKTTQCFNPEMLDGVTSIYDYLVDSGKRVLTLSLPSYDTLLGSLVGAYLGKKGRIAIKGQVSKEFAWILWSLDRAQHNAEVSSWLKDDAWSVVLSNRWTESNLVYQQTEGIDEQRILRLERNVLKPTHTILLDIPVDIVDKRLKLSGGSRDFYEDSSLLETVRNRYLRLAESYQFGQIYLVDASRPAEAVSKDIIATLKNVPL